MKQKRNTKNCPS